MRIFLRSGLLPLVALCAGLVGLGVLEYRWTDELARAEQDRLGRHGGRLGPVCR